jgi:hypothetical protein
MSSYHQMSPKRHEQLSWSMVKGTTYVPTFRSYPSWNPHDMGWRLFGILESGLTFCQSMGPIHLNHAIFFKFLKLCFKITSNRVSEKATIYIQVWTQKAPNLTFISTWIFSVFWRYDNGCKVLWGILYTYVL